MPEGDTLFRAARTRRGARTSARAVRCSSSAREVSGLSRPERSGSGTRTPLTHKGTICVRAGSQVAFANPNRPVARGGGSGHPPRRPNLVPSFNVGTSAPPARAPSLLSPGGERLARRLWVSQHGRLLRCGGIWQRSSNANPRGRQRSGARIPEAAAAVRSTAGAGATRSRRGSGARCRLERASDLLPRQPAAAVIGPRQVSAGRPRTGPCVGPGQSCSSRARRSGPAPA